MKSIILIGDSIRHGYQPTVAAELAGRADLWAPQENCSNSRRVLENLDAWVIDRKPDVVHLNCGLHDLARRDENMRRAELCEIGLNEYRDNLIKSFTRIRQRTNAVVIWASSTPVNGENHHRNKPFDRWEPDVEAYNTVASAVVRGLDGPAVPVNDLYGLVMREGRDRLLLPDGVHFTQEGYAILGRQVADAIGEQLRGPSQA